jgi:hypothetical protein
MRKFNLKKAILLFVGGFITILFLSFHQFDQSKKEVCKNACPNSSEILKDGNALLWESLSRQFVNNISSY